MATRELRTQKDVASTLHRLNEVHRTLIKNKVGFETTTLSEVLTQMSYLDRKEMERLLLCVETSTFEIIAKNADDLYGQYCTTRS